MATVESATALNGRRRGPGRAQGARSRRAMGVEFAQARVSGLEVRLTQSAAAVAEAKRVLVGEWTTWKNEQAEVVVARFEQAISPVRPRGESGEGGRLPSSATPDGWNSILRGLALPDPRKPYMDHATPARLRDWPELPEARDVSSRLGDVGTRVMPLVRDLVDAPPRQCGGGCYCVVTGTTFWRPPTRCMVGGCSIRWSAVACAGAGNPGAYPGGWCRLVASRSSVGLRSAGTRTPTKRTAGSGRNRPLEESI